MCRVWLDCHSELLLNQDTCESKRHKVRTFSVERNNLMDSVRFGPIWVDSNDPTGGQPQLDNGSRILFLHMTHTIWARWGPEWLRRRSGINRDSPLQPVRARCWWEITLPSHQVPMTLARLMDARGVTDFLEGTSRIANFDLVDGCERGDWLSRRD
jgi:hypothetical protein